MAIFLEKILQDSKRIMYEEDEIEENNISIENSNVSNLNSYDAKVDQLVIEEQHIMNSKLPDHIKSALVERERSEGFRSTDAPSISIASNLSKNNKSTRKKENQINSYNKDIDIKSLVKEVVENTLEEVVGKEGYLTIKVGNTYFQCKIVKILEKSGK